MIFHFNVLINIKNNNNSNRGLCVWNGNHLFAGLIFGFDAAYNNFIIWKKTSKKKRNVQENNLNQFNYFFIFLHFISSVSDSLFGQVKCNLKKKKEKLFLLFSRIFKVFKKKNKLFPAKQIGSLSGRVREKDVHSIFMKKGNEIYLVLIKKSFKKNKKESKRRKERRKSRKRKRGKKKEWTVWIVVSAPAFNNASAHPTCPFKAARCKGHQPSSFFHSFILFQIKIKKKKRKKEKEKKRKRKKEKNKPFGYQQWLLFQLNIL